MKILKSFIAGIILIPAILTACKNTEFAGEQQTPRFKAENGVYTNVNAEKTNKATLMFAGDMMISKNQAFAIKNGEYEYEYSFDYVSDIIKQSDFAAANLEALVSKSSPVRWEKFSIDTPKGAMANLNSSEAILAAVVKAGFDAVVTANNHMLDGGLAGVTETIDKLDEYGLLHTGTFKSADEDRYIIVDVNGIKIALLSYGTGSLNSMSELYSDDEMAVYINRYLKNPVKKNIADAKSAGADYVIVFMHWGIQNSDVIDGARTERAQFVADAGADYIVGSHPHVINRYDVITAKDGRKVPCMYSMGNFLSGMDEAENSRNRDTLILRLVLEKSGNTVTISEEGYIPCFILEEYGGRKYVIMPCGGEYGGIFNAETKLSRDRTAAALGGGISPVPRTAF